MPHTEQHFDDAYGSILKNTANNMRDAVQKLLRENIANMEKLPGDTATKAACVKELKDSMTAYDAWHAKAFA